jgi:hypothetical protein
MTPRVLTPDDAVAAAVTVEAALRPVAGRDWSVQAGPLEWDVEQTITHMLGATAKYTLYLASRCQHFIGLTVRRWPDATNDEVIDSVVPVATGLAAVAAVTPPGVRAYHVAGPSSAARGPVPAGACAAVPGRRRSGRQLARPAGGHRQATPPPPLETANPTPA